MYFAHALMMSVQRQGQQVKGCELVCNTLPAVDEENLPMIPGEAIFNTQASDFLWTPFGSCWPCLHLVNFVRTWGYESRPVSNLFSRDTCGWLFPTIPLVLTMGLRPLYSQDTLVMTNHSVMRYSRSKAIEFGLYHLDPTGWLVQDSFRLAWTPVTNIVGQNLTIDSHGFENGCHRFLRYTIIRCGCYYKQ
jgi:hypothetical protein